jgi:hypothetical protein
LVVIKPEEKFPTITGRKVRIETLSDDKSLDFVSEMSPKKPVQAEDFVCDRWHHLSEPRKTSATFVIHDVVRDSANQMSVLEASDRCWMTSALPRFTLEIFDLIVDPVSLVLSAQSPRGRAIELN